MDVICQLIFRVFLWQFGLMSASGYKEEQTTQKQLKLNFWWLLLFFAYVCSVPGGLLLNLDQVFSLVKFVLSQGLLLFTLTGLNCCLPGLDLFYIGCRLIKKW